MIRLTTIRNTPLTAAESAAAIRLALTHDERARSRLVVVRPEGTIAIVLPRGSVLRDGDILTGDDGAIARVGATAEPVARLTAQDPLVLLRAVYHLANRHVAAQLALDVVLIERDPVLERMLASLGVRVEYVELPFEPESGAYDAHGHAQHAEHDEVSSTVGEQLSIAAHRSRASNP